MRFEISWSDESEAHIAKHDVTAEEVEDAIYARPRWVAGARLHREGTLRVARTKAQLDALRKHFDSTDQSAALEEAVRETATGEVLVSTSIRLPRTLMDAVRAQARAAGVPATTLMRDWITARISSDGSEPVIAVSDLQHLIDTRARSASAR